MATKITEVTRRDIRESLSSLNFSGRLNEIDFLSRLYDLDALPSDDSRYRTAREDIAKHRLANDDWDNDWIFYDNRFGLKEGNDELLLRFLAELLHPVVRSDQDEITRILNLLNGLLAPDGYRLVVAEHMSGRPVFAATEISPEPLTTRAAARHFTDDIHPLVATIARLAELDGSELEQEVLRSAEPKLEKPEYDNLDGGTYYYTLTLVVSVELFARLGDQVRPIEERVADRISAVLRAPDHHHITAVVVQPSLLPRTSDKLAKVVAARSESRIPQFWAPQQFRLFISHVTSFKQRATALRHELSQYHISGFVAHETIDPGELWQREIEAALRSMNAMAALITPDFHESKWTDQEVGWGLGSGIYVLPVRRGADPYGFLGEVQGIQGKGKKVAEVADEIFEVLMRVPATRQPLLEAVVCGFENSKSFQSARENLGLLERARGIPEPLISRVERAAKDNYEVAQCFGAAERVRKLVQLHRSAK